MPKSILLMTHGLFCRAILESAEMITGSLQNIYPIPLLPGVSPEQYTEQARSILDKSEEGSYILTDILGGTPCNVARALRKGYPVQAFTGLNLPMLLGLDELREDNKNTPDQLCSKIVQLAAENIRQL